MAHSLQKRVERNFRRTNLVVALVATMIFPCSLFATDLITVKRGEKVVELEGEVLVDAQNGDAMLRSRDGKIWLIEASEIVKRSTDDKPFEGLTDDAAEAALLAEFPEDFEVYRTRNYVICHNTSDAYAQWVGALYERLRSAFTNYWTRRDFELHAADTPMVILIFNSRENYVRYATNEIGGDPGGMVAYYNLESNRVTMYDLTGTDGAKKEDDRRRTSAQVNALLAQPGAFAMVATVVHEATHQLAFNTGLQTRFADWPFWVSEGLAMYFETPSLNSSRGWNGLGKVNRVRLVQMRGYMQRRPANSLETLIADDTRFRDGDLALNAYAEAWAMNYFLLHKHSAEYVAYLKALGENKPLLEDGPEARVAEFKKYFGDDLEELDREFTAYIKKLK